MTLERTPERTLGRFDWIDYARFAAALSVMLYHYYTFGPQKGYIAQGAFGTAVSPVAAYGFHGVELFFMISGFVIMLSVADRSAAQFAAARIRRLYPGYLFCMSATALGLLAMPHEAFPLTFGKYLANTTMLAPAFGETYMDAVYWTLVKELTFYGAVCLLLLAGQRKRLEGIVQAWLLLRAGALAAGIEGPLLGDVFELFIAGCLLYFGTARGWTPRRLLAVLGSAALVVEGMVRRGAQIAEALAIVLDPFVLAGLGLAFFALFLIMARIDPKLPAAHGLGALTYPLYLLHHVLGYLAIARLTPAIGIEAAVAATAIGMMLSAAAVARFVERRPRALWTRLSDVAVRPLDLLETRLAGLQMRLSSPLKGP